MFRLHPQAWHPGQDHTRVAAEYRQFLQQRDRMLAFEQHIQNQHLRPQPALHRIQQLAGVRDRRAQLNIGMLLCVQLDRTALAAVAVRKKQAHLARLVDIFFPLHRFPSFSVFTYRQVPA